MAQHGPDIVVVKTCSTEWEASLAQAQLESAGIGSAVLRDDAGGMFGPLQFVHGIRVAVRRDDADAAAAVLADEPVAGDEAGDDAGDEAPPA